MSDANGSRFGSKLIERISVTIKDMICAYSGESAGKDDKGRVTNVVTKGKDLDLFLASKGYVSRLVGAAVTEEEHPL